jgi:hypothetical protein
MTNSEQLYTKLILIALKNYTIEDLDDYHDAIYEIIDGMCIYTKECKTIVDELDYDVFQEDDLFGRPRNYEEAAYNALYQNFYKYGPSFEEYAANNLIAQ